MSENSSGITTEDSVWNLIRIGDDNHTCINASIETENFHRTKYYMYMYLRFMIIYPLFNVILHVFSLFVFFRMRSKSVLVKLLMSLSMAEVIFQASTASSHLLIYLMETGRLIGSNIANIQHIAYLLPSSFVVVTMAHIARNWSVLLIAIMRYEFVCRHSWKRFLFRKHNVTTKVISVWFMALCVSSLRFLEMQFWICESSLSVTFMTNNLLQVRWYEYGYIGVVLTLVQNVGPVTAVCILSGCLLNVLFRQRSIRKNLRSGSVGNPYNAQKCRPGTVANSDNSSLSNRSTDLLVVLLCVVYALCELPPFLKVVNRMDLKLHELGVFMNVMICVDSTLGFFIYLVTNPDFRNILLRTCCCRIVSRWMNVAHRRLTWTERQSTFERSRQADVPVLIVQGTGEPSYDHPLIGAATASTIEMDAVTETGRWSCAAMDIEDNECPITEDDYEDNRLKVANSTTDSSV